MSIKSPDPLDVQVGSRIRLLREVVLMSQTELGEHLGVTCQQVQKYEKGLNRVGAGRLTKIAAALGVPVSELLARIMHDGAHFCTSDGQPRAVVPSRGAGVKQLVMQHVWG